MSSVYNLDPVYPSDRKDNMGRYDIWCSTEGKYVECYGYSEPLRCVNNKDHVVYLPIVPPKPRLASDPPSYDEAIGHNPEPMVRIKDKEYKVALTK